MNLPGFLSDHDGKSVGVRPAAAPNRWCAEQYDECVQNCSFWPDPGVCECYCRNQLCSCTVPGCPMQRCE